MIEGSRCVAPNVVPMKASRPLVEGIRVLNGSAVSAGHEWDIIVAFFKWIRRTMQRLLGKQESP